MACLFAVETVPVAPEVPSVIAVFSDVTIELMAESAVLHLGRHCTDIAGILVDVRRTRQARSPCWPRRQGRRKAG